MFKRLSFVSGAVMGVVLAASVAAYAALGGSDGVRIPYSGQMDNGGVQANGSYTFRFDLYDAAVGGTACSSLGAVPDVTTTVTGGAFHAVIGPVNEACVVGKPVWVSVAVKGPTDAAFTPLVGRQRVYPAVGALTSGTGDFKVSGTLTPQLLDPGFTAGTFDGCYFANCPAGTSVLWANVRCASGAVGSSHHSGTASWYGDCAPNAGCAMAVTATCARMTAPPSYPDEK